MDNRILIIDDEPTIRKLLARMLELEGYEIFQADDCTSGMKQLTLRRPQLVLCDVFLPDGNGVELVKSIKAVTPDVEVILLTAHGNIPDGVQAIKKRSVRLYNQRRRQQQDYTYHQPGDGRGS